MVHFIYEKSYFEFFPQKENLNQDYVVHKPFRIILRAKMCFAHNVGFPNGFGTNIDTPYDNLQVWEKAPFIRGHTGAFLDHMYALDTDMLHHYIHQLYMFT